jgi:hypothetical protein
MNPIRFAACVGIIACFASFLAYACSSSTAPPEPEHAAPRMLGGAQQDATAATADATPEAAPPNRPPDGCVLHDAGDIACGFTARQRYLDCVAHHPLRPSACKRTEALHGDCTPLPDGGERCCGLMDAGAGVLLFTCKPYVVFW